MKTIKITLIIFIILATTLSAEKHNKGIDLLWNLEAGGGDMASTYFGIRFSGVSSILRKFEFGLGGSFTYLNEENFGVKYKEYYYTFSGAVSYHLLNISSVNIMIRERIGQQFISIDEYDESGFNLSTDLLIGYDGFYGIMAVPMFFGSEGTAVNVRMGAGYKFVFNVGGDDKSEPTEEKKQPVKAEKQKIEEPEKQELVKVKEWKVKEPEKKEPKWLVEGYFYKGNELSFEEFEDERVVSKFIAVTGQFSRETIETTHYGKWTIDTNQNKNILKTSIRLPDLSKFDGIMFSIKSAQYSRINIVIIEKISGKENKWTVPITECPPEWKDIEIPFRYFQTGDDADTKMDLNKINRIQFEINRDMKEYEKGMPAGNLDIDNILFYKD